MLFFCSCMEMNYYYYCIRCTSRSRICPPANLLQVQRILEAKVCQFGQSRNLSSFESDIACPLSQSTGKKLFNFFVCKALHSVKVISISISTRTHEMSRPAEAAIGESKPLSFTVVSKWRFRLLIVSPDFSQLAILRPYGVNHYLFGSLQRMRLPVKSYVAIHLI